MEVLVIGGSGPSGIPLINGLLTRGHHVTMLHTGTHKPSAPWYTDGRVEVLACDPFDEASLRGGIGERRWDAVFVMYGRLRMIAKVLHGRISNVWCMYVRACVHTCMFWIGFLSVT